jgi:plastocyanin
MRKFTPSFVLLLTSVAVACTQPGSPSPSPVSPTASTEARPGTAAANTPLSATMQFGLDTIGSHFPAPSGHDASGNARDNLVPRTVVIDPGGTVTFKMGVSGVHQVAIYEPGTDPEDINTSILTPPAPTCPPVPLINDPNNRVAVVDEQMCNGGSATPSYTFTTPGRYLVICAFLPHFNMNMYGWVIVRNPS